MIIKNVVVGGNCDRIIKTALNDMKLRIPRFYIFIALAAISVLVFYIVKMQLNYRMLNKIIERLSADSRVAEVIVTDVKENPNTQKTYTTIKFMEYDTQMRPLSPKYFTFSGNIIQFQSLVIRFDDFYIKRGDRLKGKSAYIFWKVFMLDGENTQEYPINKVYEIPCGYKIEGARNSFEGKLWRRFWEYALNPKEAKRAGIKSAQIEAPGTKFVPGMIYTIKIEHDGGLRIDAKPLSPILKNEKINF